jgi:hypothetical protein
MMHITTIAAVSLVLVVAGLLYIYRNRKLRIAAFARQATFGARSPRDAAFALGRTIFSAVKRGPDPLFLTRLLAPLGASPPAILEKSACCSGIHRLYITSLNTIGVRAAQISVYSNLGVHCMVQAQIEGERVIIDADYGVWLKHPRGGPINLQELQAGVSPIIEPFVFDQVATYADSTRTPRPAGYPGDAYYRFDFAQTRTANWTRSTIRRVVYAVLKPITRGGVDSLLLPPILEWPEILLALLLSTVALMAIVVRFLYPTL